ncbi:MAG: terminase family protein [Deltaproteobacteria bacterium]|jgi:hypothetical protein|nr:terminase family protein [Deltaproteobacteria bacterium]
MSLAPEIIAPQPGPQALLVSCPCSDILYGGARGGGKSYGLLLAWLGHERRWGSLARGVLFRRTFAELEDLQLKATAIFSRLGASYLSTSRRWSFASGASLKMRYLDRDEDADNYQGHEYSWIGFDEAGNWLSPIPLDKLRACLRSAGGAAPRLLSTCNPGGPGHNWVKARYIDPAPPFTPFVVDGFTRVFIPARVSDNLLLTRNDPGYAERLKHAGPDWLVRAWLEGDWDIVAGGALDDLWRRDIHVLPSFEIPASWRLDRSFDWGSSRPFSVGWWAESDGTECRIAGRSCFFPAGTLFRVAEYYGWNGRPNEGCRMLAAEVAREILKREARLFPGRKVRPGPADAAIYAAENGNSIGADMEAAGVRWLAADKRPGSRKAGFEALRKRLKASLGLKRPGNQNGQSNHSAQGNQSVQGNSEDPGLFIFDTCAQFIRTVPTLPRDPGDLDDVDSSAEDHAYDDTRYRLMTPKSIVRAD